MLGKSRLHLLLRLAASGFFFLSISAAPALAGFGKAVTLSKAGQPGRAPEVAIDRKGRGLFVWYRFDGTRYRVQMRTRSAGGKLGVVKNLSEGDLSGYAPDVAMNARGDAIIAWFRSDGTNYWIEARARSASGKLSDTQTIFHAEAPANATRVTIDRTGNAVIAWQHSVDGTWRIEARARSASGHLAKVQTISQNGVSFAPPRLVSDPDGNVYFTWLRNDGATTRVQARRRSAAGELGAITTLSKKGLNAFPPDVAVYPDGTALLVWSLTDGVRAHVQARTFASDGALGSVDELSPATLSSSQAQVSISDKIGALIAWSALDGEHFRIQVRTRSSGGVFGQVQTVSKAGEDSRSPRIAIGSEGDGYVSWVSSGSSSSRIQARTRTAAGKLGDVETLSPKNHSATMVDLAVNDDLDAAAVWQTSDGVNDRVQGAAAP